MKIGQEKVSNLQKNLLSIAEDSIGQLARGLLQVTKDDDILESREDIHPKWEEFFWLKREQLASILPSDSFRTLDKFFSELDPLEPIVRTLDPGTLRTVFVLGAGASKPQPSGIPTVKELLPQLLERGRRLDRDDVQRLADFCEKRQIDNIEDLLTAAQLATFCSRNPLVLRLLNFLLYRRDTESSEDDIAYFQRRTRSMGTPPVADVSSVAFLQDTLQVLFGLLASTMLPAKPNHAHQSIAKYASEHPDAAIVTTNYDCCMDLALGDINQAIDYGMRFNDVPTSTVSETKTPLIKLHGSLNWYYCETCQEVQQVNIRRLVKQYANDEAPYAVIGICKDCGGQRRGLLVPPLAMKFDAAPPLTPLLERSKSFFRRLT